MRLRGHPVPVDRVEAVPGMRAQEGRYARSGHVQLRANHCCLGITHQQESSRLLGRFWGGCTGGRGLRLFEDPRDHPKSARHVTVYVWAGGLWGAFGCVLGVEGVHGLHLAQWKCVYGVGGSHGGISCECVFFTKRIDPGLKGSRGSPGF